MGAHGRLSGGGGRRGAFLARRRALLRGLAVAAGVPGVRAGGVAGDGAGGLLRAPWVTLLRSKRSRCPAAACGKPLVLPVKNPVENHETVCPICVLKCV